MVKLRNAVGIFADRGIKWVNALCVGAHQVHIVKRSDLFRIALCMRVFADMPQQPFFGICQNDLFARGFPIHRITSLLSSILSCNGNGMKEMEAHMKRYVIQMYTHKKRSDLYRHWITLESMQYDTLEEAKAAFARLPIKADHRIAEAYTVVRYKPVKI